MYAAMHQHFQDDGVVFDIFSDRDASAPSAIQIELYSFWISENDFNSLTLQIRDEGPGALFDAWTEMRQREERGVASHVSKIVAEEPLVKLSVIDPSRTPIAITLPPESETLFVPVSSNKETRMILPWWTDKWDKALSIVNLDGKPICLLFPITDRTLFSFEEDKTEPFDLDANERDAIPSAKAEPIITTVSRDGTTTNIFDFLGLPDEEETVNFGAVAIPFPEKQTRYWNVSDIRFLSSSAGANLGR